MNKTIKICIIFFYSDCTKIYHFANLIIPFDTCNETIKRAFNTMHDSFCDANFYCREEKESDGEYLFKKVCEENKWAYLNFIEKCEDNLIVESEYYIIDIYDDF